MNKTTAVQSLVGLLLFSLGVGTGIAAQSVSDSAQRQEKGRAILTGPGGTTGMEVITSIAEYKPGQTIERHFHHGIEAAYVIAGAPVQAPGQQPFLLATGATPLFPRDLEHAGFTVVGDTPLQLFTVHVVDQDKPLYQYVK